MNRIALFSAAALFAGSAFAGSFDDNHDTFGTVLLDQGQGDRGSAQQATSHVASAVSTSDAYGSVLFDIDQPGGSSLASQPAIGDDDYGNILYDLGARY
jgi:hypothetical protein